MLDIISYHLNWQTAIVLNVDQLSSKHTLNDAHNFFFFFSYFNRRFLLSKKFSMHFYSTMTQCKHCAGEKQYKKFKFIFDNCSVMYGSIRWPLERTKMNAISNEWMLKRKRSITLDRFYAKIWEKRIFNNSIECLQIETHASIE